MSSVLTVGMEASLQEQFNLPLVQDLIAQNDELRLTANLAGTKIADSQIKNVEIPYRIKNKLLMAAGEFNGVVYPAEEIQSKIELAQDQGLIYDHLDTTQNQGTSSWVGQIDKPHWDENGKDGPGLYGDLVVLDKPCAQKLAAGAKWGISPTIDYEKNEVNGKIIGSDLLWKSFSFVMDPAVRATMLNQKKKEAKSMPEEEPVKKKKLPYKYPEKGKDEKEFHVEEDVHALLTAKDEELTELRKFHDAAENAKKAELVAELTSNEFLIGRIEDHELADREKHLLEKSTEVLTELTEVIGSHAELQSYRQFVKTYMKKHKGSTIAQAAKAWKKQAPKGKGNLEEEPEGEPAEGDGEETETETEGDEKETESLTGPSNNPLKATAELQRATNPNLTKADKAFYEHMCKQGGMKQ